MTVPDLVVAGDYLLRTEVTDVVDLTAAVVARSGARGVTKCVVALPQLRRASASPMETRARLAFARWKLPEPELNVDILDAAGGWKTPAIAWW